jgi:peptidoglycan/LPS O-acetylase OafA/YrhL
MVASQPARLYYPELDTLRFLAFSLVLVHHSLFDATVPGWAVLHHYGWMGVDLFLCLSAFMFARLLFAEFQSTGTLNVGYFYVRRALRIWPLYFTFLAVMLVWSIQLFGWSSGMFTRSVGMLTFTDNLLAAALGYNTFIVYSAHLWTISYEEQFYLAIPWALRILYRMTRGMTAGILGAVVLLTMVCRAAFIGAHAAHPAIWVLPFTHSESIFGGLAIGLGLFDDYLDAIPEWTLLAVGLVALWLVTRLPNVEVIQWKLMLTYPLLGLGMSLVLLSVMRGTLWGLSLLLGNTVLRYLGKISYGLYVYHLATERMSIEISDMLIPHARGRGYAGVVLVVRLMVTVGVAAVSYHILERPFLRLKERFTLVQSRPI